MKNINIFASAFILFALNVNSFATDKADNIFNSIETNKGEISFNLNQNGRNHHLRSIQDNSVLQLATTGSNEIMLNTFMPKGRNVEALDATTYSDIELNTPFYAKAGRNKQTVDILVSMK